MHVRGTSAGAALLAALAAVLFCVCAAPAAGQAASVSLTPVSVADISDASAVAAGRVHACGLRSGHVACWGYGPSGELGNGATTSAHQPVAVEDLSDAVQISSGYGHSCARRSGGNVVCWGLGNSGELGNGKTDNSSVPVPVSGLTTATALATGYGHSCARRTGGSVVCWGYGDHGRIGTGLNSSSTPAEVSGLTDATDVSAGYSHTCALRTGGHVACWGSNFDGELGNGTTGSSPAPVAVTGLNDATSVSAGTGYTCAVRATGSVACWGNGSDGRLGNGSTNRSPAPVDVSGLTDAISVSAGEQTACAVRAGGTMVCWGAGASGQLGNGTTAGSLTPTAVADITDATSVSVSVNYACATRVGGTIMCWGADNEGQLGNGTPPTPIPNPTTPQQAPNYTLSVSARSATPSRGYAEVTWKATAADPDGTCQLQSHPSYGRCSGHVLTSVIPAAQPCVDGQYGGQPWTLGSSTATSTATPSATGTNRVCAVMLAGPAGAATVVARAESTVEIDDVYPTRDLDCRNFATQAAAQQEFNRWRPADPHRLDGDNDGRVCERNPCPCYYGTAYPLPSPAASPQPIVTVPTPTAQPTPPVKVTRARVTRVIDGDTIAVRTTSGKKRTVRLLGIDTPESKRPGTPLECGAKHAARYLRSLLLKRGKGRKITLTSDPTQDSTDRYGRTLAYVQTTTDVGKQLLAAGWATTYVYNNKPVSRAGVYATAADNAKTAGKGIWRRCNGNFHQPA